MCSTVYDCSVQYIYSIVIQNYNYRNNYRIFGRLAVREKRESPKQQCNEGCSAAAQHIKGELHGQLPSDLLAEKQFGRVEALFKLCMYVPTVQYDGTLQGFGRVVNTAIF